MKLWTIILPCGNLNIESTNGTLQHAKHLPWEDEQYCFKVSNKLDLNAITDPVQKDTNMRLIQTHYPKSLSNQRPLVLDNNSYIVTFFVTIAMQLQYNSNIYETAPISMPMAVSIAAFHGGGKYKTQTTFSIS